MEKLYEENFGLKIELGKVYREKEQAEAHVFIYLFVKK